MLLQAKHFLHIKGNDQWMHPIEKEKIFAICMLTKFQINFSNSGIKQSANKGQIMDHFCPKTYTFISYKTNYVAWYWLLSTAKKLNWWRLSSAQVYGYKNKYVKEDLVTCPQSLLTSTISTLWPGLMGHHQREGNHNGKARSRNIVMQLWHVSWTWKALLS